MSIWFSTYILFFSFGMIVYAWQKIGIESIHPIINYYSYTNIFLSILHPKQKLQIIFWISFVTFFTTIFDSFSPFLSKRNQINCHLLPINCLPLSPVQPSLFLSKQSFSEHQWEFLWQKSRCNPNWPWSCTASYVDHDHP